MLVNYLETGVIRFRVRGSSSINEDDDEVEETNIQTSVIDDLGFKMDASNKEVS